MSTFPQWGPVRTHTGPDDTQMTRSTADSKAGKVLWKPDGHSDRMIMPYYTDAADVFRMMQTTSRRTVSATLATLRRDPVAGEVTEYALIYLATLFGRRTGEGVAMAQRALRLAIPEAHIAALSVTFTERLLA